MSSFRDKLIKTKDIQTTPVTAQELDVIMKQVPQSAPGLMNFTQKSLNKKLDELEAVKEELRAGRVAISKIVEVEGRRRSLTPQQFSDLKGNIEQNGLIHKIVVRPLDNGQYEVVAGHNRLEVYRQLGRGEIEVDIQEIEGRRVIENAFYSNLFQSELTAFEKYQGFKEIREITGETQEIMARKAGISRQQVTSLFAFEEFPESAHEILKNNPGILGYTAAGELKKLSETKLLDVLNKLVLGEITEAKAVELTVEKPKNTTVKVDPIVIRKGKFTYASIKQKGQLIAITLGKDTDSEAVLLQIQNLLKSNIE
jgi:ParB family chromosome partitioning protein